MVSQLIELKLKLLSVTCPCPTGANQRRAQLGSDTCGPAQERGLTVVSRSFLLAHTLMGFLTRGECYVSPIIWMCLDCVCLELAARWLQLRDNEISRVRRREGPYSDLSPQMKPHLGSFSMPRQLVRGGTWRALLYSFGV